MRRVTAEQRRATTVARHHLSGDAAGPRAVVDALVALHATDPATVHLSVLARSSGSTVADTAAALYEARALVRWTAMRRTLFVVAVQDVPVVRAAVSTPLAATLRRALISRIERNGLDPALQEDVPGWLAGCEEQVRDAVARRGAATGAELRADVPALRSVILPGAPSESRSGLTSPLLTLMGTEGSIVRGGPVGAWTTRNHRWEPVDRWWPEGLPVLEAEGARTALARRWLERYGPAGVEDLRWWTGWSLTTTRRALLPLDLEDVDLDGRPGIDLAGAEAALPAEPVACLLPALDPTPMGWKDRDWFTAVDRAGLYDAAGNIGPSLWWDGELIGGWASTASGVRVEVLADRGKQAEEAADAAAAALGERLDGVVVTPAARTPLERRLSAR